MHLESPEMLLNPISDFDKNSPSTIQLPKNEPPSGGLRLRLQKKLQLDVQDQVEDDEDDITQRKASATVRGSAETFLGFQELGVTGFSEHIEGPRTMRGGSLAGKSF